MSLFRLQNASLGFGGPNLLSEVDLTIEKNERICLIGRNGEGKSTLLKVILGLHQIDSGERIVQKNTVIAQLEQDIPELEDNTVYEIVASGLSKLGALLNEYHQLSQETDTMDDAWLKKLTQVQQELENNNGWHFQQQLDTILSKLNLPAESHFNSLSGGLKRRVLLGRALIQQPNLLLLDEPTNHLDIEAILWLEEYLKEFNGSILFITHDRSFLRALATRIIELDRGKIISFDCDYDTYQKRKEELLNSESVENARFDKKLAQEEVWIRQGIKARRTRNEGRVRSLEKMREEFKQRRNRLGSAKLTLHSGDLSGKLIVEAKHISFAYHPAAQPIIKDFTTTIQRGDKIGIIGPNGAGKSTLLNILLGQLKPTSGKLKLGTNRQVAYFDQLRGQLDLTKNVRDNLDQGSDQITINGKPRHIISYLQDFLFTPDRIHSPVSTLSGGEKNRLLLAKLFIKPANILVLDEPTNDLDIETLELLEELLLNYTGTLLLVSHDRSFLNNVVTSTIAFEGKGIVEEHIGGYDDWLKYKLANQSKHLKVKIKKPAKSTTQKSPAPKKARKLSYKEQQELEQLPLTIEALEKQIQAFHDTIASPNFYKHPPQEISQLQAQLEQAEKALEAAFTRWEHLEEIA